MMLTAVPWPELAKSARRIVRTGCQAQWTSGTSVGGGAEAVPIRCYATSNFGFATIVACRSDLPKLLARSGLLIISSAEEETIVLNFQPTVATLLSRQYNVGAVFLPQMLDRDLGCTGAGSDPVLIFGRIHSVELRVPSHAIDVIAPLRAPIVVAPAMSRFGLN